MQKVCSSDTLTVSSHRPGPAWPCWPSSRCLLTELRVSRAPSPASNGCKVAAPELVGGGRQRATTMPGAGRLWPPLPPLYLVQKRVCLVAALIYDIICPALCAKSKLPRWCKYRANVNVTVDTGDRPAKAGNARNHDQHDMIPAAAAGCRMQAMTARHAGGTAARQVGGHRVCRHARLAPCFRQKRLGACGRERRNGKGARAGAQASKKSRGVPMLGRGSKANRGPASGGWHIRMVVRVWGEGAGAFDGVHRYGRALVTSQVAGSGGGVRSPGKARMGRHDIGDAQ
jgi:hypothetical protein